VTGIGGTPEDVVEKLQAAGGIDPQELDRLMNKFPLLATPEVQQHFNRYLGGLTSGELDLADLRKDAVKARDELKDLKKDLGPYGGALDGYLSILESFIDETKPAQPEKNKPGNPEQKTP